MATDATPLYDRRRLMDMRASHLIFLVQMIFLHPFYLDTFLLACFWSLGVLFTRRDSGSLLHRHLHFGVNVRRRACVLWVCFCLFCLGFFQSFSFFFEFSFFSLLDSCS